MTLHELLIYIVTKILNLIKMNGVGQLSRLTKIIIEVKTNGKEK